MSVTTLPEILDVTSGFRNRSHAVELGLMELLKEA